MKTEKFLIRIGDLIGEDKIRQVVTELKQFLQQSDKIDELIVQSARYTDTMNQIRRGTISLEDAEVSKNKIRYALIDIMREIEMVVEQDELLLKEANQTLHKMFPSNNDINQGKVGVINYGKMNIKGKSITFGDVIKN